MTISLVAAADIARIIEPPADVESHFGFAERGALLLGDELERQR